MNYAIQAVPKGDNKFFCRAGIAFEQSSEPPVIIVDEKDYEAILKESRAVRRVVKVENHTRIEKTEPCNGLLLVSHKPTEEAVTAVKLKRPLEPNIPEPPPTAQENMLKMGEILAAALQGRAVQASTFVQPADPRVEILMRELADLKSQLGIGGGTPNAGKTA